MSFRIEDEAHAEWALRTLARARQQMRRIQDQATAEIERVQRAAQLNMGKHLRTDEAMVALLSDYMHRRVAAELNLAPGQTPTAKQWKNATKTLNLPAGRLQLRRGEAKPTVVASPTSMELWDFAERYAPSCLRPRVTPGDLAKLLDVDDQGHVVVKLVDSDTGEIVEVAEVPEHIAVLQDAGLSVVVAPDIEHEQPAWLPEDEAMPDLDDVLTEHAVGEPDPF